MVNVFLYVSVFLSLNYAVVIFFFLKIATSHFSSFNSKVIGFCAAEREDLNAALYVLAGVSIYTSRVC